MTYVEEIIANNPNISERDIAIGLRTRLGDDKVIEIYDTLLSIDTDFPEYVHNEYNCYWIARKLIEMDNAPEHIDGLKYPKHNWINGELWPVLGEIGRQLNRLKGVQSTGMVLYKHSSIEEGPIGVIWLEFDTIEDFNHFLWAGCHRYIPLSRITSGKWRMEPDLGDPDYYEDKIRMNIVYLPSKLDKYEYERDIRKFADCISEYADAEQVGIRFE